MLAKTSSLYPAVGIILPNMDLKWAQSQSVQEQVQVLAEYKCQLDTWHKAMTPLGFYHHFNLTKWRVADMTGNLWPSYLK